MSLTITDLGGAASTTDGTTFPVAPSFAVTVGSPVLFVVMNTKGSTPETPTVTDDASNTYTQVRTRAFQSSGSPTKRLTVFRMDPVSTTTVTLTVDFSAATQTGFFWNAIQCAGAQTGASLVVQSIGDFNDSSATNFDSQFNPALASFADAVNNATIAVIAWGANNSGTKGGSMTLIRKGAFGTPTSGVLTEYAIGEVTQPTCSWTGSAAAGGIAMEIAAAAAAATVVGTSTSQRSTLRRRRR